MVENRELERAIGARTNFRVQNLRVELSSERVVLRGEATSFHVKQLAQEGVRDVLPMVRVKNAIVVRPRIDHFVAAEAS